MLNKNYGIKIENKNEFKVKDCDEHILISTDGSKDQNEHTGFGITFSEGEINEIAEPLPSYSSIFQAEAIAIWTDQVMDHLKSPELTLLLCSDVPLIKNVSNFNASQPFMAMIGDLTVLRR